LACFAMSQDVDLSPLERFVALERSFMTLVDLSQRQPQYMRLARAARDYGARSVAVAALGQLSKKLVEGERVDLHEPFLAPGQRFDAIAPRTDGSWILAAALEEFERLGSFSSFYTGAAARARLELITRLGYASEEMHRRLQLIRARFPQPST
jgi:hypothetical protein